MLIRIAIERKYNLGNYESIGGSATLEGGADENRPLVDQMKEMQAAIGECLSLAALQAAIAPTLRTVQPVTAEMAVETTQTPPPAPMRRGPGRPRKADAAPEADAPKADPLAVAAPEADAPKADPLADAPKADPLAVAAPKAAPSLLAQFTSLIVGRPELGGPALELVKAKGADLFRNLPAAEQQAVLDALRVL